ncbi:photosystem II repair protein Psb32 [Calothrix sp. UHCC 0171]|uniref:photosystem II repair protein Psb32 n=1 Tax=Calothrix sp. UHCC 0171 TaxID=3110245 RepID=UPI002B218DBD|nr:TPM domain-containing protein [Calothrix sp. UHCC 0171]MEA5570732.1 TPM domain-containing protein [Calothrix sp. UHCC 0171]
MKQLLSKIVSWRKLIYTTMRSRIAAIILSLIITFTTATLLATPALATGVYEMPNLTPDTWVVDEGDIISRTTKGKISSILGELAQKTGNEVRFVTVHRLDYGETPESFTQKLLEKWFPSSEARANQTILMIDTVSNGIAILTGDKVKSLMSDDIAQSVAFETFLAPLRDGDKYNQAFLDASDRLVAVLSGQPDPGPPQIIEKVEGSTFTKAEDTEKQRGNATAWVIGLLIAATVIPMATYYLYQVNQPSSSDS